MGPITRTCDPLRAAALALLIAAPAVAQTAPQAGAQRAKPAAAPSAPLDGRAYVRGRLADAGGAPEIAAASYGAALAARPDDSALAMRAYRQALAAGDYALASKAGAVLVRTDTAPPDTAVLAFSIALRGLDRAGAQRALDRMESGPLAFLVPPLSAWLAVERGADPWALLAKGKSDGLAGRYAAISAPLLDHASRKDVPAGVAALYVAIAEDIAEQDLTVLSILLTRAALLLDPGADQARILLASALSNSGSYAPALAVLERVRATSHAWRAAEAARVAVYLRAGRNKEAMDLALTLASYEDATLAELRLYADTLAETGAFERAATAYSHVIAKSDRPSWDLHLAQGRALDAAGRWGLAQIALRRAVALGPKEAEALETLGVALVRHGGDLKEAQSLLERARALQPKDPGIADALAWAYFNAGDTARAVPLLEEAVKGDPAGVLANEHLGDAYWRQGRRYEARYAWSAAALHADADGAARLKGKLADGIN